MDLNKKYILEPNFRVWINQSHTFFNYSDGEAPENYIYRILKDSKDVSCSSDELVPMIKDWPSEYHLSPARYNLLIPLQIKKGTKILELGCGMGAITRYLGETGAYVTAVEGSLRRAKIARERCRDLNNVAVVCDNFKNFRAEERFDVVTLIGVMEYAPKYIGGDDPIAECLEIAKKHLKPDGSLLVAIENRLGLKYWNNCAEDHTGGMFDSIHDNYPPGKVVTFGYEEIKTVLSKAGFSSVEFLFPFPDYKLANLMLNENSFRNKEMNFASMIGQTYSRDYSGQPYRCFSERLAWHTLERNGLIPHLANSFLIIAHMSQNCGSLHSKDWIAKIYNAHRNACYRTETTLSRDIESGRILVKKERMYKESEVHEGPLLFNQNIETNYIPGMLFSDEILKLFQQREPYRAFIQKMTEYKDTVIKLSRQKKPVIRPDYCAGELIDCTPFNLIRTKDKSLHYIDNEWTTNKDVPLVFVLLRGILGELTAKINYFNDPGVYGQFANIKDLSKDIFNEIGIQLSDGDIEYYCQREASIQAQVAGVQTMEDKIAQNFRNLFSAPLKNVLSVLTRLSLWSLCKLLQLELKSRDNQVQATKDQAASAYCDMGLLYSERGEKNKALECYESAVKIGLTNITVKKRLAESFIDKLDRKEAAMQIYIEILKKNPDDVDVLIALGDFNASKNRFDNARTFYEKALTSDPKSEIVLKKIDVLIEQERAAATDSSFNSRNRETREIESSGVKTEDIQNSVQTTRAEQGAAHEVEEVNSAAEHLPMVSIVILTFNQLKFTQECIESIRKHTPEDHKIIFVDNGSTDGTVKWLKDVASKNSNYYLIDNGSNLGFARGCNQGINASTGEYIILLNNDVVVTENWLSGMIECVRSGPGIGIVGPMTNNISGTQKDLSGIYKTIKDMHLYAKVFREKNRHRRIPLRRIVGFCMLFRREFVEKVGLLDESFGTGNFEDDDYCLRASLEGYQNMVAGDVFIHHYGSRSFIGNRIDYGSAMAGNRKVFNEKWSGINSGTELGKKLLISSALENADELSQQGKVDKAVEKYIEGIGQSPETLEIYHALAGMLLEAKRYQESLDALKSMPDEGKGNIKTIVLSGYCAEGLGRYQEAEEYADFVLEKDSGNAFALNLKGMLAYKRDDRKTADISFKKAIETDPGYGEPYTNLGVLQWSKGDREAGISLLEKGFILSPKVMDIATMYHAALCEMRAFERGEKIFREAKGLYPQNQRIVFLLVDLLLQQGKEKIAMEEIEEAMTKFAVEDGLLAAALAVREKVGAEEIDGSKKKGTLSLSMIVKNEEQHIAKCLMSMKPVVNEMIVVDTGSTDRTKNIAKALGAKVYDFNWTGDFSTARNHSLSKVSGEWILSLDADEVISARDYNAIKEIVGKGRQAAYKIVTRNYSTQVGAQGFTSNTGEYPAEEAGLGWFPSGKVRLFPNNNHIRFENPVHEFVEGTVTKAGIPIKTCDITVHHYGRLNMEKVQEKGEAYYLLGMKKLVEKGPSDLKALFELGVQAGELKKYKEAAKLFEKLVGLDPNYPLALFNLGFAYLSLGRYEEALEYSKRAFEIDPSKKECAVNYAHCEIVAGNIKKGISLLEETLGKTPEYPPAMVVLASAYAIEGRKQAGIDIIEKLHANRFDCANCLHDLADGLFIRSRYQHAMSLYELIVRTRQLHNDTRERIDRCYEEMCKAGMA